MRKAVEHGQSLNAMAVLGLNTAWGEIDGDFLQKQIIERPKEVGREFTAFLKNGGRMVIGEPVKLSIDRSIPFDPSFIGKDWTIEEENLDSLKLGEINLSAVRFEAMLEGKEKSIQGEERLRRHKATGDLCLDAKVFQTLWENQHLIPERWKEKTNGNMTFIYFFGTVLRRPDGGRYVLYLYWHGGQWSWNYLWLEDDFNANLPSALLAS